METFKDFLKTNDVSKIILPHINRENIDPYNEENWYSDLNLDEYIDWNKINIINPEKKYSSVGKNVLIVPDSIYYKRNTEKNPSNMFGVITVFRKTYDDFCFIVSWFNGAHNEYRKKDLTLINIVYENKEESLENTYIKEQLDNHLELDPYGEEDWDDDNLTPVLQIAKQENKPYDQITYLNCSYKNLTNLDGIENLINLRALDCYNNLLTNLNGIENLVNLECLYCYDNNFSNDYKRYLKEHCKKKNIELII